MPVNFSSPIFINGVSTIQDYLVERFELYNATTNTFVRVLENNDTILLGTDVPTLTDVGIRGRSVPDDAVGSFRFDMSGASSRGSTENVAPYTLYGDNSGDYNPWGGNSGTHTLRGRIYTDPAQGGTLLKDFTITFTIV